MQGIARLGRIIKDPRVARSADVAAWCWGTVYVCILGFNLLALNSTLSEKLLAIYTPEQRSVLLVIVLVLGVLLLIGLAGFIRSLWRLRNIRISP
jgi:hypothetical protein